MRPTVKYISIALLIIAIALLTFKFYPRQPEKKLTSEEMALNFLLSKIETSGLYKSRISLDCLSFITDEMTTDYVDFSLHENHSKQKCGGDPDTSPRVDSFRVLTKKNDILWFGTDNGEYLPFEMALTGLSNIDCPEYNEKVKDVNWHRPYIGEIIANGRTQFYSAPNENCIIENKFIVTGDTISVYSEFDEWAQIMYINPKTKQDFIVWVLTNSIKINAKPDSPQIP